MSIIFAGIIGLVLGSFLGVVVDRVPIGESVIWGRSHCASCGARLTNRDLIPVISQVLSRSRCTRCGAHFSWKYAIIEILSALTAVSCWLTEIPLELALFFLMSLVLSVCDWREHAFPVSIWLGFTLIILAVSTINWAFILFLILSALTERFVRKMGAGDVLWLATASLIFSFQQLIWLVQCASLAGILFYFVTHKKNEIPFVPFLSAASVLITLASLFLRQIH
ncbi:MAG: prepilin peptidase [Streptococcaceae bacterium]|jgi:leader peptidase (prepilin peptidase)/N-methyltransferase|nr:prepilin peptidase [Streptococcaceae bacterium]